MSVDNAGAAWDPVVLAGHFQSIAEQSQKLMLRFLSRQPDDGHLGMGDPSVLGGAFLDLMTKMMSDPAAVAAAQIDLFNDSMTLWRHAAERMLNVKSEDAALPRDKRFSHPEWSENATFSFIRESYLVASKSLLATVRGVKDLDPATARKVDFYTRQFVDAMSPSNFIATNPEVLSATLNTGGENLLRGLEHVLADLDHGDGRLADRHDRHECASGSARTSPRRRARSSSRTSSCSSSNMSRRRRRCASGRCSSSCRGSTSTMCSTCSRRTRSSNGRSTRGIRCS